MYRGMVDRKSRQEMEEEKADAGEDDSWVVQEGKQKCRYCRLKLPPCPHCHDKSESESE